MRAAFFRRTEWRVLTGLVLIAFLLRALVPAGFMPSASRPFALELCPSTFPADWLAQFGGQSGHAAHAQHHDHHAHHAQHAGHETTDEKSAGSPEKSAFERCSFGSAPSAAPVGEPSLPLLAAESESVPDLFVLNAPPARLIRSQKARAPPAFS
jgi:hypothetical protein